MRQLIGHVAGLAKRCPAALLVLLLAVSSVRADTWKVTLGKTTGSHIPKIIGASGTIQTSLGFTGFDYFQWFGITHLRYWFKPAFSPLNPTGGVTDPASFNTAAAALRASPDRQGSGHDVYFDWARFNAEFSADQRYQFQRFGQLGITPMMVDTLQTDQDPRADWGKKFMYWRQWYCYVYFFASRYDITMYQFANEPHAGDSYSKWESHWLVCADAMRKAIADVNAACGKHLTLSLCGPTEAGPYWDYHLPDPRVDFHGWGNASWSKIHTDLFGHDDPSIWNYGMYDYHKYSQDAAAQEGAIKSLRQDIAEAKNAPNSTIPILISEFNTSTGGHFNKMELDTEDIKFGIGLGEILQSTAALGEKGLGDDGGFFLFKLGAAGKKDVTCGIENQTAYVSRVGDDNYGGVTRGGVCFQLYAHHFRGGKPLLDCTVTAGGNILRKLTAVWDERQHAYYAYLSNMGDADATVVLNVGALDVRGGAPVTVARVDKNDTGQITDYLSVSAAKTVTFDAPRDSVLLVWIPQNNSAGAVVDEPPVNDTYLVIGEQGGSHGAEPTMRVSLHHSKASERRIGFVQFNLSDVPEGNRFLLKLPGHNSGANPSAREILHVYGAGGGNWSESDLTWETAPGVGKYYTSTSSMAAASGQGSMVDIEDNYEGVTSGVGSGLGLYGQFLGPVSYSSSTWATNYVDVTDYVKSLIASKQTQATFVIARIVRFNGAPEWSPDDPTRFPLFPLVLVDDIPLLANGGYFLAGRAESPAEHLKYLEQSAEWRSQPLKPTDDPLRTYAKLMANLPSDAQGEGPMIAGQLMRLIDTAYRDPSIDEDNDDITSDLVTAAFAAATQKVKALNIRWNPQSMCYVRGDGSTLPPVIKPYYRRTIFTPHFAGDSAYQLTIAVERKNSKCIHVTCELNDTGGPAHVFQLHVVALTHPETVLLDDPVEGSGEWSSTLYEPDLPAGQQVRVEISIGSQRFVSPNFQP